MFQTDQPTASPTLPTPAAAGTPGFFTNGNPASGVAATIVDADILNMMMMELVNVVLAAGETPSKTTYTQVRDAIKRLSLSQQVIADTGTANAYAAANASPLTALPATGFVQCVSIAHANTGASTYAPDGLTAKPIYGLGLQPLQGGELPVGVAVLMYLVQSGVNSGNGAWIALECTGGAQQTAPATQSQHAVQLQQNTGIVGTVRNLRASLPSAGPSLTITADEIGIKGALGGQSQIWANANSAVSTSNTNAIGGVVGTALAASGYAGIYAAYNPSTGAFGFYAKNANSLLPNVDTSLPGWFGTLVSVWTLNPSTQFAAGFQSDRRVSPPFNNNISLSNNGTLSSLSIASIVPPNAKRVQGSIGINVTGVSVGSAFVASGLAGTAGLGEVEVVAFQTSSNGSASGAFPMIDLITAQTIFYAISATGSVGTSTMNIAAYEF